ncbi:MAG: hypothetical protein CVV02_11495 [Firmicutes bacterium HGW-Firmicutes-7]|nr:MAG: hypothetical protein CVV02_11495 [Firmicutes bacterium HGW-Firmicutes-7]
MLELREGILDALVDDDESIVQIEEYLTYLKIDFSRTSVLELLQQLLDENKIKIEYPPEFKTLKKLNISNLEEYWFELTQEGHKEWGKI